MARVALRDESEQALGILLADDMMRGIARSACYRVRVNDRLVGVLVVESNRTDALGPVDFEILKAAANQAGIAIGRARLLQADPHAISGHRAGDEDHVSVGPPHALAAEGQVVNGQAESIPALGPGHGSATIDAHHSGVNLRSPFACGGVTGARLSY